MDPIIRSAPVTTLRRSLGRPGSASTPAPVATPDPVGPIAPVAKAAPLHDVTAEPAPIPTAAELAARMADESAAALARAGTVLEQAETRRREWEAQEAAARAHIDAAHADLQQREQALDAARRAHEDALQGTYEEAARRGYEEGLAHGTAEGRAGADAAAADRLAQLDALARAMDDASRAALAGHEDMLVEVAWTAICRIAGELAASRDGVLAMVRAAAAQVRDAQGLRIRLHPQDAAWLGERGDASGWTLQADAAVLLGGCIVDGPQGSLDARLELQLERLRTALAEARAHRAQASAGDAGGQG